MSVSFFDIQNVLAAPIVADVNGDLISNQSVTISGSSFGTKISNQASPIRFETWGIGNEGKTAQEASGGWWTDGRNTVFPRIVNTNKRISSRDVIDTSMYPSGSSTSVDSISRMFYKNVAGFDVTGKMLLNFWFYTDISNNILNDNINTQLKFLYFATDVVADWPWGNPQFTMPFRAMSLWENSIPDISNSTMVTYDSSTLGSNGVRNDLNNTANLIKAEGWYNLQIELKQGEYGVEGGSEKISIVGPNYTKYGTSSVAGNPAYVVYPEWQSGVASPTVVWYQGKRYMGKSVGIVSTISPDNDSANWHEVYASDKLNSVIFWLWSQKRGNNDWNYSNQTLIGENEVMYDKLYYEVVQSGATDFTAKGAASNDPGTVFKNIQWTRLGAGDQVRIVDEYKTGSKVDYNGEAYQCISDIVSLATPAIDSTHWSKVFSYRWPSSTTKMFLDGIYMDNSFARIEIGDNSVYANCTHREIQVATSWSDGQIDFAFNQGSLPNGQAYLFVIDENGVPSAGHPIIIGEVKNYSISNFTTLVSNWFHLGSGNVSDFNFDNIANTKDLGIMMSKWQ